MDNQPLVSVIVPTHNRPDFLRKTLKYILDQNYKNIEIIVVSNGFSQINRETVEQYNDIRMAYYEQENSGGPASPRNHGIRKAKGDYIAFCDDDDLWMPDKLEKQVKAMEIQTQYGLCYTKMIRFNEDKEWIVPHEEGEATLKSLLYNNNVPISSVLVKKSLINQIGFFCESKSIGTAEDYEFLLRCSARTPFLYIDEYLIKYWSGEGRASFQNPTLKEHSLYCLYVASCFYFLWKSGGVKAYKLFIPYLHTMIGCAKALICQKFLFPLLNLCNSSK